MASALASTPAEQASTQPADRGLALGADPLPARLEVPQQARRLRQFLVWVTRVAIAVGVVDLALTVARRDTAYLAGAVIALVVAAAMFAARRSADLGRADHAVYIVSGGVLLGALGYVLALPGSSLAPAVIPLLLVALAVPYLHGRALRRLAIVAWAGGVGLVVLNTLLPPSAGLPGPFGTGFRLAAFAAVAGLAILLLVHSSARLHESLTETRGAHRALRDAHARLQGLAGLKTQFLNNAAHELRTPLTPVMVELHMLRSGLLGPLTPQQERGARVMERNLERLNKLVEDILDIARLQAGRMPLAREPVELSRLLGEAAESFQSVAEQRGVALEVHCAVGLRVEADPKRLMQVVFNLLSNALKFTPRGGRVVAEALADDGGCIVRIVDTGAGFPPGEAARLFQPFTQLHEGKGSDPGAGLGLYVARGIVEAHGGRIWASSGGLGQGSVFAFTLPGAARPPA
ncbi:MAG TPA: HAMP domain-containing sensor histidine kinase [Candidatus Thermoplasmatota archaeon]|nr:HAMP domain-containing sensor histidine kinase [Candidatus Thermoplasmatota archaeon]